MNKKTYLAGIRATGKLHIGNYLGALQNFVELSNNSEFHGYFFIADLHALTTPFEPKELREDTLEVVAEYIAAGLNLDNASIFLQNHLSEHTELAWIFNCITPLGELERMTQFKDKAKQHKANINAGLLTYPTLMAADILLYKPDGVPVGEDQVQHVELARVVARKFNSRFGKTFPEPKPVMQKPLRIKSLRNPENKMSKTGEVDNAIWLDDSPEEIKRKLRKAVTATDAKGSAGVDNLLLLLRHFGTKEQIQYFEDGVKSNTIKYSELKDTLAETIAEYFADFRDKKKALLKDTDKLAEILAQGAKEARLVAHETLVEVKQKVGLL
jgi:tryptophanyl-tRNA synthetase